MSRLPGIGSGIGDWESASVADKNKLPSATISYGAARETMPNRCVSPTGGSRTRGSLIYALCTCSKKKKKRKRELLLLLLPLVALNLIACWILNFHTKFMFPAPASKYKIIKITSTTCSLMINATIFVSEQQWINN